jgi:mono/diheme cytochrome c family protein
MKRRSFLLVLLIALSTYHHQAAETSPGEGLVLDVTSKTYEAQRGETNLTFIFNFANGSTRDVTVKAVRAQCKCTTLKWPFPLPGRLEAGSAGQLQVDIDLHDRKEPFKQVITIETSAGTNHIQLAIKTPELTRRERERLAAFADRQAIFKGDCARCHFQPVTGKSPREQYPVLCGTCHDSTQRAEMVPDLMATSQQKDQGYWEQWVRKGKPGTFMPAYSKPFGGPLTEEQVEALIAYLKNRFHSDNNSHP